MAITHTCTAVAVLHLRTLGWRTMKLAVINLHIMSVITVGLQYFTVEHCYQRHHWNQENICINKMYVISVLISRAMQCFKMEKTVCKETPILSGCP